MMTNIDFILHEKDFILWFFEDVGGGIVDFHRRTFLKKRASSASLRAGVSSKYFLSVKW